MERDDQALLRLHIEAVWGVRLPPIKQPELELLADSTLPDWKLCAAQLTAGRVYIWRPGVSSEKREALRQHVNAALTFPLLTTPLAGVSRELAFSLTAEPRLARTTAQSIARLLTPADYQLITDFQSDNDYLQAEKYPLVGVVVGERLVCLAHSSRRTSEACELGIDTRPEARRQGYALAATIVWAQTVIQEGLVPIYSALAENTASLRLAEAAGYRSFARIAVFKD